MPALQNAGIAIFEVIHLMYKLLHCPRGLLLLLGLACFLALGFAVFYLQGVVGLTPCPMCIVQREMLIVLGVACLLATACKGLKMRRLWGALGVLAAALGAFTAAKQSWMQINPPEFSTCGRDLYGIIESFPIGRAIPMIFSGSGECSVVDWTFLGGTIANWSLLWFIASAGVIFWALLRKPFTST